MRALVSTSVHPMKLASLLLATVALFSPVAGSAQEASAWLDPSLAGPQRSEANRARDGARHPRETLLFFGLQPNQTVLELSPGGGWYTEILAPVLRDRGQLLAAHAPRDGTEYERKGRLSFEEKLKASPTVYDRVKLGTLAGKAGFSELPLPPASVDLVLTFRNLHNWLEAGHLDDTLRAVHAALKPGGVLGVEEHRATPGTSIEQMKESGYMTEAYVIERAQAAGFRLAGRSEVNANPKDGHQHPNGVWSLPPTLRGGEVDRAKYLAIGESDRMTLRFVKAAK
jgi:predicted methyltransferase